MFICLYVFIVSGVTLESSCKFKTTMNIMPKSAVGKVDNIKEQVDNVK